MSTPRVNTLRIRYGTWHTRSCSRLLDSHLVAVSFGYGLAMLWIGGLFLPACKGSPSALLALAYMAYGLKVRDRVG